MGVGQRLGFHHEPQGVAKGLAEEAAGQATAGVVGRSSWVMDVTVQVTTLDSILARQHER
jgi:hypothetical protein